MKHESIFYNTLKDWSKKEVTPQEKSEYILFYLEQENISLRELSRRLNIPYSTLQDWVSMRQIKKAKTEKDNVFILADKLLLLLSKNNKVNQKAISKLRLLRNEIDKIDVITI